MIMRHSDHGMAVSAVPAEIDSIVSRNSNRRIAIARSAARNRVDSPGKTVIAGGDYRGISAAATLIGNICSPVGANFDMPVKTATIGQCVNGHGRAVGESAVQADGAGSVNHIL